MMPAENMNATIRTTTAATIPVNTTFLRLVTGATTIKAILAERAAIRAEVLAHEGAYARRRREWTEAREQFLYNCAF